MKLHGSKVFIKGEFITLGQLLKFLDLVATGGEEKLFLQEHEITFNGEKENRRGKKLRDGDHVSIDKDFYEICSSEN